MTKLWPYLLVWPMLLPCLQAREIVIFSSFNQELEEEFKINHKIQKLASRYFLPQRSNYSYRFIFNATVSDFAQVIQREDLAGVFWVSHGAQNQSGETLNKKGGILDSQGVDLSPLLSHLPSHLPWLALIGCYTSQEQIQNIKTPIDSYDQTIELEEGLESSFQKFLDRSDYYVAQEKTSQTIKKGIILKRSSQNPLSPVFIYHRGQLIRFLPATNDKEQSFFLPLSEADKIQIKLESKNLLEVSANLGEITSPKQMDSIQYLLSNPELRGINKQLLTITPYKLKEGPSSVLPTVFSLSPEYIKPFKKSCAQAKTWKTDKNSYCKQDWWNGCHRAKAQYCFPLKTSGL